MILALAFYGSLAALALWATWRESDLRWIGLALGFSYAASNAIWFFGEIGNRAGVYTMCEIFIALAAYMAWEEHRYRMLAVLGAISAVSIAANIAFAWHDTPTSAQVYMHEVVTNICFALECIVTTGIGVWHGVGAGRFHRWIGARDAVAEPHGFRGRKP